MSGIGTLRETGLHAALKAWYARPGDSLEARVDGFIVDILRGETVIEIQTHHFSALKRKLQRLIETRSVRLVHPIALERWVVRVAPDGATPLGRRKSPRRGCAALVFDELVSFPELLAHPNFSLEVVLIREDEIRCPIPAPRRRAWARRRPREWRVCDRRLLEVVDTVVLETPADCLAFLPEGLGQPFTNRHLASALGQTQHLSQKITYCLRRMGAVRTVGKQGRALLHARG
jgi:hypothetical protein